MSPPSIVLVPGMSSVGSVVYEPLVEQLHKVGLTDTHAVDLPSIDCLEHLDKLSPNPLEADVTHLRSILRRLVDQEGKDVLVVAHSYGGTPTLAACEGLWKHKRNGQVGVTKAVLLSSSVTLPGGTVASDRMEWQKANGMENLDAGARVEVVGETPIFYPDGMDKAWLNDLPSDQTQKWFDTLRPSALGNALSPAPTSTVSSWRIAYMVLTEMDLAMPERFQRWLIERAKNAGAPVDEVKAIKSGHFVQITHAEEVAEWIRGLC